MWSENNLHILENLKVILAGSDCRLIKCQGCNQSDAVDLIAPVIKLLSSSEHCFIICAFHLQEKHHLLTFIKVTILKHLAG